MLMILGIDVSHHQGKIKWDKIPNKYEYVYIKATEGSDWIDPLYNYNFQNAVKYLNVGSYHYLTSSSDIESQFNNYKNHSKQQNLIPMIDVEIEGVQNWSKEDLWKNLDIFIKLCKKEYGVKPIIYSTQRSYNTLLAPKYNNYILMIGKYSKREPTCKYDIWQYTEKGKVKGISKQVDISKTNDLLIIKYQNKNFTNHETKFNFKLYFVSLARKLYRAFKKLLLKSQ